MKISFPEPSYSILAIFLIALFPIYPGIRILGVDFMVILSMVLMYFILLFVLFPQLLLKKKIIRKKTPVDLPLLIFFCWLLITFFSGIIYGNKTRYILGDFLQIAELPIFFLLATSIFHRRDKIFPFLRKFFIFSAIFAAVGLVQWLIGKMPGAYRCATVKLYGGNICYYAAIFLPLLTAFHLYRQPDRKKALFLTVMALFSFLTLITWSKSIWLGTFSALLLILVLIDSMRRKIQLIRFFGGFFLLLLIFSFLFSSITNGNWKWEKTILGGASHRLITDLKCYSLKSESFQKGAGYWGLIERVGETRSILRQAVKNPFPGMFGYGMGSEYATLAGKPHTKQPFHKRKHNVHCSYAEILLRTGFVGLTIFLWFIISFFWKGLQFFKKMKSPSLKGLALGILATFFSIAVMSFGNCAIIKHPISAFAGTLAGLLFMLPLPEDKLRNKDG